MASSGGKGKPPPSNKPRSGKGPTYTRPGGSAGGGRQTKGDGPKGGK